MSARGAPALASRLAAARQRLRPRPAARAVTPIDPLPRPRRVRPARFDATAALLAGAALLGGCANPPSTPTRAIPRYVAPADGPTARFLVRSQVTAGELYGVYVLEQGDTCSGHRIVGAGDTQRHPPATTLAAERLQTIEVRLVRPDKKVCAVRWSFTPGDGKTYLLRGLGLPTGCNAVLIDMTDVDRMRPASTAVRRNTKDKACVPIAEAKGPSAGGAVASEDAVLREGQGSDELRGLIQP